ncbi:MAG TPA: ATP-dependent sacrificial sulfur transferase LarE [Thermodesulfovibrionales bacterium]|nr:ATP-dependent sacrificial sulfur transferase LarE [Thermodesulfovibrionales bacterium]
MSDTFFETPSLHHLTRLLTDMESAVIAFSGGVDSTFLLKVARLSGIRTLAVTALSPSMPEEEFRDAREIAGMIGIPHLIIETAEIESPDFARNPVDRCFYCKDELFWKLKEIGLSEHYRFVLDGSNLDDMDDWRPGRRAALKHGVRSPLIEAGFRKGDIRRFSRALGLPTWDKAASPCLSSRFPYGEPITLDGLKQVGEAERFLKSLGFGELRVRHHRETARIELKEDEIPQMLKSETRRAVVEKLKSLGYKFISLDLGGFRSGNLNG